MILQRKILLYMAGMAVISIIITSSIISRYVKNQVQQRVSNDLIGARIVFDRFQRIRYGWLLSQTRVISESPHLKAVVNTPDLDHKTILFSAQEIHKLIESDLIILTDTSGILLAQTERPDEYGEDISQIIFVDRALRGEEVISTWIKGGRIYQVISVPLKFGEDIVGVLISGYELNNWVAKDIQEMTNTQIVFTLKGKVISSTLSSNEEEKDFTKWVQENERSFSKGRDILKILLNGENYIVTFVPLVSLEKTADAYCIFLKSLDKAFAFFKKVQLALVIIGFGAVSLAIGVSFILSKNLTRPIMKLVEGTRQISEGDLTARVQVKSRDEIGVLADSFNQMAQNLHLYNDKIMDYSTNLEAMVEKRTKELEIKNTTLSTLNSISTVLSQSLDLEKVVNETLKKLLELTGLKASWVLLQRDKKKLHLLTHKGLSQKFAREEATKPGDNCLCIKVLETGETMVAEDMLECPRLNRTVIEEEGLRCHASIPLKAKDKVLGALNLASNVHRQFTSEELGLLAAVGNQIGIAIDNAELFQNLQVSYKNLQEVQAQLIQVGKMSAIGELAGGVAHEFNNLMTGIRGYAELARQRGDEKTITKALDVILTSSDRAKSLTTKLLAFSRSAESTFQRVSIEDLINDTLDLVARQMEIQNIRIIKDFASLPPVEADPGKLQQTFLNLLINAYHAMADGGTFTISTRVKDDKAMPPEKFVEISFQDTGCGIPQENLDRIFEPFFTTKGALGGSSIAGTGLGLSLSYRYISDHNGTIEVESEVGKGSTFTITLPVKQDKLHVQQDARDPLVSSPKGLATT